MTYSAKMVLRCYGEYMMPRSRMHRPKQAGRPGDRFDTYFTAWIVVVTCRGYRRSEHWVRAEYLFKAHLDERAQRRLDRFTGLLHAYLLKHPFDPDVMSEETTRRNLKLAMLGSRDAAMFTQKSIRTIQRWCDQGKLAHEWRGKRLFVRLGDLLALTDPKAAKRGRSEDFSRGEQKLAKAV